MQGAPFEFDQNNELHRKAQHYLETMDREVFPTFGDVMVTAIVDYFDRYYGYAGDENSQLEAVVARTVEETLRTKLPEMIRPVIEEVMANGASAGEPEGAVSEEKEKSELESVEKDINWGFLGG